MMAFLHCPYCYHRIDPSRLGFQCTGRGGPDKAGCKKAPDEARQRETGYSNDVRPSFQVMKNGRPIAVYNRRATCPDCGGETGIRACPCCHTPLPTGFGDARSPLIGLVGARGTGKTVYLTVLTHELRSNIRRRFNADIRLAGDRQSGDMAQDWLRNNEHALLEAGNLPAFTRQAVDGRREPIVFEWRQPHKVLFSTKYRTSYLCFYDTAGDDLVSLDSTLDLAYLGAADYLIMLLDPLHLRGMRDRLALPSHAIMTDLEPISVLGSVTEMLRTTHEGNPRKKINIPVAVAFVKIDALFGVLGDNNPILRLPATEPSYDDDDGLAVHEHVRSLLHAWGADDVDAHLESNYNRYRYFAVSSLGAPPDYAKFTVNQSGVRPFRVEDPLLWLLSRAGTIPLTSERR